MERSEVIDTLLRVQYMLIGRDQEAIRAAADMLEALEPPAAAQGPSLLDDMAAFLRRRFANHYECEDCWYSCAQITCSDREGKPCDCGKDISDALLARYAARSAGEGTP